MSAPSGEKVTLLILSDIHYAGAAERTRGSDYELAAIKKPLVRLVARLYRHFVWMRDPFARSPQLNVFLKKAEPADLVIVNGDYTCDSAFIGLADPAALESAVECLDKLKAKFGDRLHLVIGDHEVGKKTMFSENGSMRLASWQATTGRLGLKPLWKLTVGNYLLLAVASPLIALPANRADSLADEWPEWQRLREEHMDQVRSAFAAIEPHQRVLLFCHDPTALPFLGQEEIVRRRLPQIEQTIIGHLHTDLVFWKSRLLSGIPPIRFLGQSIYKITSALHQAHEWRPFKVRLCPALAGIELLNDGGYFTVALDPAAQRPAEFTFHPLPR
jgi:predicted MPP superfamily phosphohydrolase